jgi:hypothetical protein
MGNGHEIKFQMIKMRLFPMIKMRLFPMIKMHILLVKTISWSRDIVSKHFIKMSLFAFRHYVYRVSLKFGNGLKCQYLSKYSTYFDQICFITFSNSIQSFLHQNCVRGYIEGHFMVSLVIPIIYSLAPQIKFITEGVTAFIKKFLGIIF